MALVLALRDAIDRLRERSWLDTAAAIGQIARVYAAERTTAPARGLTATIRPAVETLLRRMPSSLISCSALLIMTVLATSLFSRPRPTSSLQQSVGVASSNPATTTPRRGRAHMKTNVSRASRPD